MLMGAQLDKARASDVHESSVYPIRSWTRTLCSYTRKARTSASWIGPRFGVCKSQIPMLCLAILNTSFEVIHPTPTF